jgi:hypothetical protein
METAATTAVQSKPNKNPSTPLIIVLIVILIGTGIGAFIYLKPKNKDSVNEIKLDDDEEESGASGRTVTETGHHLTDDEIRDLLDIHEFAPTIGTPGSSLTNPIYFRDKSFMDAVDELAKKWQENANSDRIDAIRSMYNVGISMMGRDVPEQECIEELFGKLPNVDFTINPNRKYLAFPVYGTYEPQGRKYRAELQSIINSGWQAMNLTRLRDDNHPWFCKEIGLNLLVGTTWSNTPTTHNVMMSYAPRSELNFYKKFNRCWVSDRHLADKYVDKRNSNLMVLDHTHPHARSAYCASGMFEFVRRWIAEIDRLDSFTKIEAFEHLVNTPANPDGTWYITTIDPETGQDTNFK